MFKPTCVTRNYDGNNLEITFWVVQNSSSTIHDTFYADAYWFNGDTITSGNRDYLTIAWYPYTSVLSGSNHVQATSSYGTDPASLVALSPSQVTYSTPDNAYSYFPLDQFETWVAYNFSFSVGYPSGAAVTVSPGGGHNLWLTNNVNWAAHA